MPLKPTPETDRIFKELARRYVELEGDALRQELRQQPTAPYTPQLDRKVRRHTRGRILRCAAAAVSCAAACLLAVIVLPALFHSAVPAPADSLSEERLPFSLPVNLTVSAVQQDQGKRIVYLKDIHADDVVLTMEEAESLPSGTNLTAQSLGSQTVYTRQTPDYQLLLLQKDGTLYTLTCRYELGTLTAIGEQILKGL